MTIKMKLTTWLAKANGQVCIEKLKEKYFSN
jgi:hypothetical protein